jgi:hypothetical protein
MLLFYIRNHLPPDPVMELVVAQQIFNGIANLSVMMPSAGGEVEGLHCTRPLDGYCCARNLSPDLKSADHFLAVLGDGE